MVFVSFNYWELNLNLHCVLYKGTSLWIEATFFCLCGNSILQRKHKSGFRRSDKMVDHIIRGEFFFFFLLQEIEAVSLKSDLVTIQTGLMTLIFAGLDMLFYLIKVCRILDRIR